MTDKPHDRLAKAVFGQAECAAALLQGFLPDEVLAAIDLESMELVPGSWVDEALAERRTDLLYRVGLEGRDALLYLVLEHQSTVDRWMAFRLLRYVLRIWERWREDEPDAMLLPPVLCLVLFHGERAWDAPTRLRDLCEPTTDELGTPDLEFQLVDLSAREDEELRVVAVGSALASLALLLLKHGRADDVADRLRGWMDLLQRVVAEPSGLRSLELLLVYLLKASDRVSEESLRPVVAGLGPEAQNIMYSTADRLRDEGLAKGRAEGRVEGRLESLRKVLEARFGSLPDWVGPKLEGAGMTTLEVWLIRALTADKLEDVFRQP